MVKVGVFRRGVVIMVGMHQLQPQGFMLYQTPMLIRHNIRKAPQILQGIADLPVMLVEICYLLAWWRGCGRYRVR